MIRIFTSLKHLILFLLLIAPLALAAQDKDLEYRGVVKERADKIVAEMTIADKAAAIRVRDIIANQYYDLNKRHEKNDADLKMLKATKAPDKKLAEVKEKTDKDIAKLHSAFIKEISKDLTRDQVDQVQDGMTYTVVPRTYANYLLMMPQLTEKQQEKILSSLLEARDYAVVASNSKDKHGWFGKYKGRIANYLSADGYDLKEEGNLWAKRRDKNSEDAKISKSNEIIKSLSLANAATKESVRNYIIFHYQILKKFTDNRDSVIGQMKKTLTGSKADNEKLLADYWASSAEKIHTMRKDYESKLGKWLSVDQVELVKNEMTGFKMVKEFEKFQTLFPALTEEHKQAIYAQLLEARENAMDVYTDKEQNQWMAKYRGIANNYLASKGYDLRKPAEVQE